jgi:hypothetical protein
MAVSPCSTESLLSLLNVQYERKAAEAGVVQLQWNAA